MHISVVDRELACRVRNKLDRQVGGDAWASFGESPVAIYCRRPSHAMPGTSSCILVRGQAPFLFGEIVSTQCDGDLALQQATIRSGFKQADAEHFHVDDIIRAKLLADVDRMVALPLRMFLSVPGQRHITKNRNLLFGLFGHVFQGSFELGIQRLIDPPELIQTGSRGSG